MRRVIYIWQIRYREKWNPLRWRHNGCDSVSNDQPHHCLLNRLFRRRSKKTSKLQVTGLCAGDSPGTGEFPAQMASYAEDVSIWWRHHDWNTREAITPTSGSEQFQPVVSGWVGVWIDLQFFKNADKGRGLWSIYVVTSNRFPSDPFMSHLATQLGYMQGSFRLCNWLALRRLVSWINHLPPACWSTFWKLIFKHQLGCRFDILDGITSFYFVFWHMQLYMSWYIISFFGFIFTSLIFFIISSTPVLISSIDVVFVLSIEIDPMVMRSMIMSVFGEINAPILSTHRLS